jgi:hypothetical protein
VYFHAKRASAPPSRFRIATIADQPASAEPGDRAAVASYVATPLADLSDMARRTGLETLGHLLEMVRLGAENLARHGPHGPNGGR